MRMSKEIRPLLYIIAAVTAFGIYAWVDGWMKPSPNSSVSRPAHSMVPHGVIIGTMVIGCPSATGLTELDKYRALGDEASYKVLRDACYAFNSGDRVTITSTDDFTRTVQIHKQGDFFDYWVHSYDVVVR